MFDARREQLDDQGTDSFLQKEAELRMLKTKINGHKLCISKAVKT